MRIQAQEGFTLLEMVMVILILGIIIAMSSALLSQGLSGFSEGEDIINANWQGQIAMERMTRDILAIRSPVSITTITAGNFAFTDIDNNTISYSLSGTNLTLTQNGSSVTLAQGVQSLTFSYFDENGLSTATASLVHMIRVSLNITQNGAAYTLTTAIYPRNLP